MSSATRLSSRIIRITAISIAASALSGCGLADKVKGAAENVADNVVDKVVSQAFDQVAKDAIKEGGTAELFTKPDDGWASTTVTASVNTDDGVLFMEIPGRAIANNVNFVGATIVPVKLPGLPGIRYDKAASEAAEFAAIDLETQKSINLRGTALIGMDANLELPVVVFQKDVTAPTLARVGNSIFPQERFGDTSSASITASISELGTYVPVIQKPFVLYAGSAESVSWCNASDRAARAVPRPNGANITVNGSARFSWGEQATASTLQLDLTELSDTVRSLAVTVTSMDRINPPIDDKLQLKRGTDFAGGPLGVSVVLECDNELRFAEKLGDLPRLNITLHGWENSPDNPESCAAEACDVQKGQLRFSVDLEIADPDNSGAVVRSVMADTVVDASWDVAR